MIITYTNIPEDTESRYHYYCKHTREGRWHVRISRIRSAVVGGAFAVVSRFLIPSLYRGTAAGFENYALSFIVGFCASYACSMVCWKRDSAAQITTLLALQMARGDFLYPFVLEPTPEGLQVARNSERSLHCWADLKKIQSMGAHTLLSFERHSFAIPTRAFSSEQRKNKFIEEIERFRAGMSPVSVGSGTGTGANWWRDRYSVDAGEEKKLQKQR